MPSDQSLPDIGMSDPNNMQAPNQSAGGKTKINKTSMDGESGQPTGATFAESLPSMKARMPADSGSEMGGISKTGGPMTNYANTNENVLLDENNSQLRESENH